MAAFVAVAGAQVLPPDADGPASDCVGQVPIVVAADEAAQSDLYSAATLAGVLDTTCIVLAGARDEPMNAAQVARLDAANAVGWIVGGEAAVPTGKVAGRSLKRLNGVDRWHTARLAGAVAADPNGDVALLTTQVALVAGEASGTSITVDGVEVRLPPGIDSDCAGQVPIVVAVDAAAQADLYSAATLAGVLDTTCIVLAGARGDPMEVAQRERLFVADGDGWIVGGEAAVSPSKVAGYNLERQGGTDRWHTARLIGAVATSQSTADAGSVTAITRSESRGTGSSGGSSRAASGGTSSAGTRTIRRPVSSGGSSTRTPTRTPSPVTTTPASGGTIRPPTTSTTAPVAPSRAPVVSVSTSGSNLCALRSDRTAVCVLSHDLGQAPLTRPGSFAQVSAGFWHACGLRLDASVDCWGANGSNQSRAPTGWFRSVSAGWLHSCGVRTNGSIACWGHNGGGQLDAPPGSFTEVSASANYSCGLRLGGQITCWGIDAWGQLDAPSGTYTSVSAGSSHGCALWSTGAVTCWGNNLSGQSNAPAGAFSSVSAGGSHSCGLKVDRSVECWGNNHFGQLDAPSGAFTSVVAGEWHSCALRADGTVYCWGAETSWQGVTRLIGESAVAQAVSDVTTSTTEARSAGGSSGGGSARSSGGGGGSSRRVSSSGGGGVSRPPVGTPPVTVLSSVPATGTTSTTSSSVPG